MRTLKVGDKVGIFYGVSELCNALKISNSYLDKLEERKILPPANFRFKKANWKKVGSRIYSEELVKKLKPLVGSFKQGVKVDTETIRKISVAFQEEKIQYSKQE